MKDEYEDIPPDARGLYFFRGYDHTAEEKGISKSTYHKEKIKQELIEDEQQKE